MIVVLFLLSILGFVAVGVRRFAWPAEHMPLWTVASFISALYVAALSGALQVGAYALIGLGLVCLAAQVVADRHRLRELAATTLTPGTCVFFVVALAYWVKFHGAAFTTWDEFSHWGLVTKELAATHALATPEGAVAFKDYPPGTALFQYALVAMTGWSEGAARVAQAVAVWAVAPVLLTGATWRAWPRIGATVAAFYLLVVSFGHDPTLLYVDQVLGVWLAGVLALLWWGRGEVEAMVPRVVPVLVALPLIKATGMVLSLTAAMYVILATWLGSKPSGAGRRFTGPRLVAIALLIAAPALAFGSWKLHVAQAGFGETFRLSAAAPAHADAERRRETSRAFGEALVVRPIGNMNAARTPPATTALVVGVLLLLAITAWGCLGDRTARSRFVAMQAALGLGGVVYAGGLLWLYMTSFDAYEGPRLASFDRYMGTYALIACLALVPVLVDGWGRDRRRNLGVGIATAIALGLLVRQGPYDALSRLGAPVASLTPLRVSLREAVPVPAQLATPGRRCYVVWQDSNGLEFWTLRYELAPRLVAQSDWRHEPWSLGEPYGPDDAWSRPVSLRAWSDMLKRGYDYVLVGHADAAFTQRYQRLFDRPVAAGLYRVEPRSDGWVTLRWLPRSGG